MRQKQRNIVKRVNGVKLSAVRISFKISEDMPYSI